MVDQLKPVVFCLWRRAGPLTDVHQGLKLAHSGGLPGREEGSPHMRKMIDCRRGYVADWRRKVAFCFATLLVAMVLATGPSCHKKHRHLLSLTSPSPTPVTLASIEVMPA